MTVAQKMILTSGPTASRLQKVYNVGAQSSTGTAHQVADASMSAPTSAIRAQLVPIGTPGARKIRLTSPWYAFAVRPDVYLNFAGGYSEVGGVTSSAASQLTCTRASVGYGDDLSGNWTSFANNIPRITNKGLLVEETRTNSIRNSACQGAVVGTPGSLPTNWASSSNDTGLTYQVTGSGVDTGIDYVEIRFRGTTVAASGVQSIFLYFDVTPTAAAVGQSWTSSVFYKIVAGSFANIIQWVLYVYGTQAGAGLDPGVTFSQPPTASSTWSRATCTYQFVQAAVDGVLNMFIFQTTGSPVTVDFTMRFGWPQLERGPFATSPIRTTNAAATRAADMVKLTTLPTLGSAYSVASSGYSYGNSLHVISGLFGAGSDNDRIQLTRSATPAPNITMSAAGVNFWVADYPGLPLTPNTFVKMAAAYAANDHAFTANGGVPITDATPASPAPALTQFLLGSEATSSSFMWNGYISDASLWATTRLTNSQLTAGTTVPFQGLNSFGVEPDVYLNFAAGYSKAGGVISRPVAGQLTCTRASTRYIDDLSGNWTWVGANSPGISNKGLLVEELRTNSMRNSSMQGAVVGTPGTLPTFWSQNNNSGIVANVVGFGTDSGVDYIDVRLSGTTAGGAQTNIFLEAGNIITAASGQAWTASVFTKMVGGSVSNFSSIVLYLNGTNGVSNTENTFVYLHGDVTWVRSPVTMTFALGTTTNVRHNLTFTAFGAGLPVDITMRIGWPQLERGAFVTSPIRTTNAAVTRAADVVRTATTPGFGSAYTIYGAAAPLLPTSNTSSQVTISADDGTVNNRAQTARASGGLSAAAVVSGGTVGLNFVGNPSQPGNTLSKAALACAANDQQAAFNGDATSSAGTGPLPVSVNTFHIGCRADGSLPLNGYITEVAIWTNQRLPNSNLITGTT